MENIFQGHLNQPLGLPSGKAVQKAISDTKQLKSRTVAQIKAYINNQQMKKFKRRSLASTLKTEK